jgi:hypothetical protein
MSIFERIRERIFGREAQAAEGKAPPAPSSDTYVMRGEAEPVPSAVPSATPVSEPEPPRHVDVSAILAEKARNSPQKLNWQTSIVDLMKLLDLDSSLQHRKELARELGYPADTDDTAAMNVWLHREVMQRLQETGGRVPDALR